MQQKLADFLETFEDTSKTAIMAILLVLGTILRVKGFINGSEFVDMTRATVVSYFGTTTITHFTSMLKDHLADKLEVAHTATSESKDQSK